MWVYLIQSNLTQFSVYLFNVGNVTAENVKNLIYVRIMITVDKILNNETGSIIYF